MLWRPALLVGMGTLLLSLALSCAPVQGTTIESIEYMTEQYPPFNYQENATLKGISIELFDAMLKDMGTTITSQKVRLLPWARAYKTVQTDPDSCLFVMTRSPVREKLFKWVGPIMPTTIAIIARKDRHISINTLDDLTKYTIGVVQDDIGQTLLLNACYPESKIAKNSYARGIIEMMNKRRIDAWAYEESVAKYFIRTSGNDVNDFERVFVLEQSDLYFAFNTATPDEIVQRFQLTLEGLKLRGVLARIIQKYIH